MLSLGDLEAASLGAHVARDRAIVVIAASLATAAAVAVAGLIGFVGLIVPHAVRMATGASHRQVVGLSMLFGASFLILCDVLARTVVAPGELPIGVITAMIGAPFFAVRAAAGRGGTMIVARDLRVARGRQEVVHGVSLEVPAGAWLSVVGPNGAGKSSLLLAIAGLLPATGEVTLDGRALRRAVGAGARPHGRARAAAAAWCPSR